MSAYIVDTFHIDTLIHAAAMWNRTCHSAIRFNGENVTEHNATTVGYALLEANIRSVQTRYPNETFDELPGPIEKTSPDDYEYQTWMGPYFPTKALTILNAISGYEYQSCEYEEFYESEAYQFCDRLRRAAIRNIPGYEDAGGWDLTPPVGIEKRRPIKRLA